MNPHPLLLAPILLDKVWGGDRLARFGKVVQPGAHVGESWELADLATTSASGAGGGAAVSPIASGPLAGRTLHDAVELWGNDLLGESAAPSPRFPLLIKYLDARENLSVQVHPSIAYAKGHAGTHIKTECWYILDAEPGAVIYKGVKPGVTRASFEAHLRTGDGRAVLDDLEAAPAVAGEMHNLPSGTVHALGAGVLVAEVQTPSDTTFRVYDWGRTGRELHIDAALACISFAPARDATRLAPDAERGRLVSTGFFTVDALRLTPGRRSSLVAPDVVRRPVAIMAVAGGCTLHAPTGPVQLAHGATCVVPAGLTTTCQLEGAATVLLASVV